MTKLENRFPASLSQIDQAKRKHADAFDHLATCKYKVDHLRETLLAANEEMEKAVHLLNEDLVKDYLIYNPGRDTLECLPELPG